MSSLYQIKIRIGDIVTLKTDRDRLQRICTGISIRQNGIVSYDLAYGATSSWHYDFEIDFKVNKATIGFKV